MQYYFALWFYASEKKNPKFNKVNVNEIIKNMNPGKLKKQKLYKKRKEFIQAIKTLKCVTIFQEKKSDEPGINDILGIGLIGDFIITNKKQKTYLTCKLPRKMRDIGAYIPKTFLQLSHKNKGAINLSKALFREVNRIMLSKKKGGKWITPDFSEKPIRWSKERVLQEIKTIQTTNVTKRDQLLKNTCEYLKKYKIIKNYSRIPTRDKTKITFNLNKYKSNL